jgi:hypothetical protein
VKFSCNVHFEFSEQEAKAIMSGGLGVVGSNPAAPTKNANKIKYVVEKLETEGVYFLVRGSTGGPIAPEPL